MPCRRDAFFRAERGGGMQRVGAAASQRGCSLSKENTPFGTPRERRGETPSTPDIAGLELEELHALRSVSAVYMASP